ncbi:hypothetical protein HHI36_000198 [Cryptolaemus montrouzieri]|uniref:Uncharacterized protein n=1 Tax=Cryptolaemus montrouzieri TaxID=559131 RepID=A0ABD2P4E4_9CUCU
MISKIFCLCLLAVTVISALDSMKTEIDDLKKIEDEMVVDIEKAYNFQIFELEWGKWYYSGVNSNDFIPVVHAFKNLTATINQYKSLAAKTNKSISSCYVDAVESRSLININITNVLDCIADQHWNNFGIIQDTIGYYAQKIVEVKEVIPRCSVTAGVDLGNCARDGFDKLYGIYKNYPSDITDYRIQGGSKFDACRTESTERRINHTRLIRDEFIACAENILTTL